MNEMHSKTLRIVCPCFNEADGIKGFFVELLRVTRSLARYRFEIVFIDDGSSDETLSRLNEIARIHKNVLVYSLSRNFGHQAALLAGIDTCGEGIDGLIMMDSDLQHPPSELPRMIEEWESGYELVSMVRRPQTNQLLVKRVTSWMYYKIFRQMSDVAIVSGVADFCLIGKQALTAIRQMPERDLFLRGALSWIGFSRKLIEFDVAVRNSGASKYTFGKMLALAKQGIFTFSTSPIRLTFRLGLGFTLIASLYLIYALSMYASDGTVRGWTSVIAVIVFFGGLNLFTLGVFGEYIARTFEEVKKRPRYVFKQVPVMQSAASRSSFETKSVRSLLNPSADENSVSA